MEYNTSRSKLILPEYGRNIQKLVEYAMTIEDREKRNAFAKVIINVMGNMNPHFRDIADFKHKLWDHLAIMSDFKLDIDSPYETPKKEKLYEKPRPISYNKGEIKYRHFGRAIELLIEKAVSMEDGERKQELIKVIMNHMKKAYLMWNKEVVSDQLIFDALKELSDGKLQPDADTKLTDTREILAKSRKKTNHSQKRNNQRHSQYHHTNHNNSSH